MGAGPSLLALNANLSGNGYVPVHKLVLLLNHPVFPIAITYNSIVIDLNMKFGKFVFAFVHILIRSIK